MTRTKTFRFFTLTAGVLSTMVFLVPAAGAQSFTDEQKQELQELFKEYIMNNLI